MSSIQDESDKRVGIFVVKLYYPIQTPDIVVRIIKKYPREKQLNLQQFF